MASPNSGDIENPRVDGAPSHDTDYSMERASEETVSTSDAPASRWSGRAMGSWLRRLWRRDSVSDASSLSAQASEAVPLTSPPTAEASTSRAAPPGETSAGPSPSPGPEAPPGKRPGRGPRPNPVCLICLEMLTSEEFRSGAAMSLDCQCRGDLALRHRDCALKWARVKGDNLCELCRCPVRNLPPPPPRPPAPSVGELAPELEAYDAAQALELTPSLADLVFDCVRVTWVAMIVSILFFNMALTSALWTGLLAGLVYSFMVRLMYKQHFAAIARLAEQQAVARQSYLATAGGNSPRGTPLPGAPRVAVLSVV